MCLISDTCCDLIRCTTAYSSSCRVCNYVCTSTSDKITTEFYCIVCNNILFTTPDCISSSTNYIILSTADNCSTIRSNYVISVSSCDCWAGTCDTVTRPATCRTKVRGNTVIIPANYSGTESRNSIWIPTSDKSIVWINAVLVPATKYTVVPIYSTSSTTENSWECFKSTYFVITSTYY